VPSGHPEGGDGPLSLHLNFVNLFMLMLGLAALRCVKAVSSATAICRRRWWRRFVFDRQHLFNRHHGLRADPAEAFKVTMPEETLINKAKETIGVRQTRITQAAKSDLPVDYERGFDALGISAIEE
jgi:hypothetical protein